ncbi:hypothetical protein M9H77_34360 [Catharanthus roseus]|uniref:Uncharacterized protein n=1 Tax=Catharanthus roseus TaxID=4058 RepID=A0ACB9ZPJ7_CATRO|nr:hypothetical protein M9H77_34360 [Catharanthus roseus]
MIHKWRHDGVHNKIFSCFIITFPIMTKIIETRNCEQTAEISSDAVAFATSRATQNLVHCQKLLPVGGVPGSHGRTRTGLWRWRSQRERKDEQRQRSRQELWRPRSIGTFSSNYRMGSCFSDYGIHRDSLDPISPENHRGFEEPASQVPLFSTVSSDNKLNYNFIEIPGVQLAAMGRNPALRNWPAQPSGMDQPTGCPGPRQDSLVQSTAIVRNDHLSRHKKAHQIEARQIIPSPLNVEDQHMATAGPSHPFEGPLQLELGLREEWPRPHGSQLGQSLGSTNSQQETSSQPETVNIEGNLGLTPIDSSSSNHNYSPDSSTSSNIGQQNVVEPINLRRSNIQHRLPGKLKNYICNTLKLLGNYVIIRTDIVGLLVN